jgi:hypothetical protein
VRLDELEQLALEVVGLAVDATNLRDLLARDPHLSAGGQLPQPSVDPVKHAPLVQRARLQ